jgi:hypothetical protein
LEFPRRKAPKAARTAKSATLSSREARFFGGRQELRTDRVFDLFRNDGINLVLRFGVEVEIECPGNCVDLLGSARAPERSADIGPIEDPAQCQLDDALTKTLLREPVEPLDRSQVLRVSRRRKLRIGAPQIVAFKFGVTAQIWFSRAYGRTSCSAARSKILYGGCTVCNAAWRRKTSICAGEKLLTPIARIFPASKSSSIAFAVSSIGVAGSGQCT